MGRQTILGAHLPSIHYFCFGQLKVRVNKDGVKQTSNVIGVFKA